MTPQRWLVTGCSTGLGRALAEDLAQSGEKVIATARRPETLADLSGPNVVTAALDVCDPAQSQAVVDLAVERFGGIDVLVNNAGYGQFGSVEEVSDDELRAQFETNVFGAWRLTRQVLPLWREQGGGRAIFVSSLSGSMPFPGLAAYTASKFALEGLAESLAQDAGMFGVKVTILQLGGFATSYGKSLRLPAQRIGEYAPVEDEMLAMTRGLADSGTATPPELFAKLVRRTVALEQPPMRLPFGEGAIEYLGVAMAARQIDFEDAAATNTLNA